MCVLVKSSLSSLKLFIENPRKEDVVFDVFPMVPYR